MALVEVNTRDHPFDRRNDGRACRLRALQRVVRRQALQQNLVETGNESIGASIEFLLIDDRRVSRPRCRASPAQNGQDQQQQAAKHSK